MESALTHWPSPTWAVCAPGEVGLDPARLRRLSDLVGGSGCVVRRARMVYWWGETDRPVDVASAVKPVITALLMRAIRAGRLRGFDDRVAESEPRLLGHDGGKNAGITWRHFANQLSGYGLEEPPGAAYSYDDYALALYYDTLMSQVYRRPGTDVLRDELAHPLGFEDPYTFNAFGPDDRPGRLALSPRDFARFGLLILRGGQWLGHEILPPALLQVATHSPLPPNTPLTTGRERPLLPGQRTLGGGRNITPVGPGFYSFNWWTNGQDPQGRRLFSALPPDTLAASGHGGIRMLWLVPSLDLIVSWNEARVEDQDASPGDPNTLCNQATRALAQAVTTGLWRSRDAGLRTTEGVRG